MTSAQRISFARPISTPGWGGDKARPYLSDAEADIRLDLDNRTATLAPKRPGAQPLVVPFENVTQWDPAEVAQSAPAARTGKAVGS